MNSAEVNSLKKWLKGGNWGHWERLIILLFTDGKLPSGSSIFITLLLAL